MTRDEFKYNFWNDLKSRFPDSSKWLTNNRTADAQRGILATWFEILEPYDLADCLAGNKAIQSGEIDWPKQFEQLPALVKRYAAQRRAERDKSESSIDFKPKRYRGAIRGFSEAIGKMFDMKAAGKTQEEISEYVATLEIPDNNSDGPRYKCPHCLDSGWRMVVALGLLLHVREQKTVDGFTASRSEAVRCECFAGERRTDCRSLRYSFGDFLPWPKKSLTDKQLTAEIVGFFAMRNKPAAASGKELVY